MSPPDRVHVPVALAAAALLLLAGCKPSVPVSIPEVQLPDGYAAEAFSQPLAAEGGSPPYSWSLGAGALPPGLALGADGRLTGAPTEAGAFSFVVQVADSGNATAIRELDLTVLTRPSLTTSSLSEGVVGVAYLQILAGAGGRAPYGFQVIEGTLPAGLTLTGETLAGTPTAAGSETLLIELSDQNGRTSSRSLLLTIHSAFSVTTQALADGYVGGTYAAALEAGGGAAPYGWSLEAGSLPSGLEVTSGGSLEGTPGELYSGALTFRVEDSLGAIATRVLALEVHDTLRVATLSLHEGVAAAPYSAALAATGGKAPYSFSSTTAVPAGLSLDASGALSGTPTSAGSHLFTAQVTDANGKTASQILGLTIHGELSVTTAGLADAYAGSAYSAPLEAQGGIPPFAWSLAAGTLPGGLEVTSGGTLTGTPSAASSGELTLQVEDSYGVIATRLLSLEVLEPLGFATLSLADGGVDQPYSTALTAAGGKPPYTFASTTTLPSGLSLDPGGALSGTPTVEGSHEFTVEITDANGETATGLLSLMIYGQLTLTTAALPDGYVGSAYVEPLQALAGTPPYTWSVTAGTLPSGMDVTSDGYLAGMPSLAASVEVTLRVDDSAGAFDTRLLSIEVLEALGFATLSLADGTVGQAYSATLSATGGKAPHSFQSTTALPPGLSLAESGALSGTPTEAGSYVFTVRLTDGNGQTTSRDFTLILSPADPPGDPVILEAATWNIEFFGSTSNGPTDETLQLQNVRDVILDAGIPLWGLQEVVDGAHFASLVAELPGYAGLLANDASVVLGSGSYYAGEQKPALLYDTSVVTVQSAEIVLTGCNDDFAGRPSLHATLSLSLDGATSPLHVLVLHMKAFADEDAYKKRKAAGACLQGYLETTLADERVLVIGDFNDDVDVSIVTTTAYPGCTSAGTYCESPYQALVDATSMDFTTTPLSLGGSRSTVGYSQMIDHHLASDELAAIYLPDSAQVLRPDAWITGYGTNTSDHYPVVAAYVLEGEVSAPPSAFLNEILHATGTTWTDFDQEFIEVLNGGPAPLDLAGWTLWDSQEPRHTFAAGTLLQPGEAIVVFGGAAAIPDGLTNAVAASSGGLSLHLADSVTLRDGSGSIRDSHSWTDDSEEPADVSENRAVDGDPTAPFVLHTTVQPGTSASPGTRADATAWAVPRPFFNEILHRTGGTAADYAEEFVELVNGGDAVLELEGWTLWDNSEARHLFPAGTLLQPGEAIVIFSGAAAIPSGLTNAEAASSGTLHFQTTDQVSLRDGAGTLRDFHSWVELISDPDDVSENRAVDGDPSAPFVPHPDVQSGALASPGKRADGSAW